MKAFGDAKVNEIQKPKFLIGNVENNVGKEENAGYQLSLSLPPPFILIYAFCGAPLAQVSVCVCPSGLVWTITSIFMDGFQNNLAQIFSFMG